MASNTSKPQRVFGPNQMESLCIVLGKPSPTQNVQGGNIIDIRRLEGDVKYKFTLQLPPVNVLKIKKNGLVVEMCSMEDGAGAMLKTLEEKIHAEYVGQGGIRSIFTKVEENDGDVIFLKTSDNCLFQMLDSRNNLIEDNLAKVLANDSNVNEYFILNIAPKWLYVPPEDIGLGTSLNLQVIEMLHIPRALYLRNVAAKERTIEWTDHTKSIVRELLQGNTTGLATGISDESINEEIASWHSKATKGSTPSRRVVFETEPRPSLPAIAERQYEAISDSDDTDCAPTSEVEAPTTTLKNPLKRSHPRDEYEVEATAYAKKKKLTKGVILASAVTNHLAAKLRGLGTKLSPSATNDWVTLQLAILDFGDADLQKTIEGVDTKGKLHDLDHTKMKRLMGSHQVRIVEGVFEAQ